MLKLHGVSMLRISQVRPAGVQPPAFIQGRKGQPLPQPEFHPRQPEFDRQGQGCRIGLGTADAEQLAAGPSPDLIQSLPHRGDPLLLRASPSGQATATEHQHALTRGKTALHFRKGLRTHQHPVMRGEHLAEKGLIGRQLPRQAATARDESIGAKGGNDDDLG